MKQQLIQTVKDLTASLLAAKELELVDLIVCNTRSRLMLRILIDKHEGVTLDECAQLNKEIGQLLEQENVVRESYLLEVCSPGLDRPLVTTRDLQRNLGKNIKLVLHTPINKQNVFCGVLREVGPRDVVIQTPEQQRLSIARDNIARARQEISCDLG